ASLDREARVTESGFASVVTSASPASGIRVRRCSSIEIRSSAGSRVGVPPPKNTVETCSYSYPASRSAARTRAISRFALSGYSAWDPPPPSSVAVRSEEHTSELQSRFDLVCRLLLEKKTIQTSHDHPLADLI